MIAIRGCVNDPNSQSRTHRVADVAHKFTSSRRVTLQPWSSVIATDGTNRSI